MKKFITLALAIVVACCVWPFAGRRGVTGGMCLVTSFDFARYPVCQPGRNNDCILAIRFYDAETNQRLAEVKTNVGMRGTQRIMTNVNQNPASMPHSAYAVTVYLDSSGSRREGPQGQATELGEPGYGN